MSEERRRFHRILFDAPVIVEPNDIKTTVLDISLNGILLKRPASWQATSGEKVQLKVILDQEADSIIAMHAEIAHLDEDKIGLHCRDIDMESISHLRRLVELNLGDPGLLERDLEALG